MDARVDPSKGSGQQLRLLVCSANLANKQPDSDSLAAWIPKDGLCRSVIRANPPYPFKMKKADHRFSISSKPIDIEFDEEYEEDEEEDDEDDSEDDEDAPYVTPSPTKQQQRVVISPEKRMRVLREIVKWSRLLKLKMEAGTLTRAESDMVGGVPGQWHLQVQDESQFDIIVIGMQEATFDPPDVRPGFDKGDDQSFHLKLPLVTPVTKKVLKGQRKATKAIAGLTQNVDYVKKDSHAVIKRHDWGGGSSALHALFDSWLPSYDRVVSFQRGQMRLEVYVKSSQVSVEIIHTRAQNTGLGGLANKGGIVTEMLVNSTTRLSFLTAHLEAHEGDSKYKMRVQSVGKILEGTRSAKWHDVSQTAHYAFVMGDLNFRTCVDPNLSKDTHKLIIQRMVEDGNWVGLNNADELHRALEQKSCMVGFKTPMCNFPPTFKVIPKEGFEWQEKRRPSYTDRILWKAAHELDKSIHPVIFEPIPLFSTSDHKPVRAAFVIELNEKFQSSEKSSLPVLDSKRTSIFRAPQNFSKKQTADKIEMWVSDISVDLHKKEGVPPNPYVAMVACPEGVFKPKRLRRRLASRFLLRNGAGWPSTKTKMGTFEPNYGDEEVKWKIKIQPDNGANCVIDGAMLLITVLDHRPAMEDSVIGSFSFNLVKLLSKGRETAARINNKHALPEPSTLSGGRFMTSLRRASLLFSSSQALSPDGIDDDDPIVAADVDEILCKNGKEVGRIRCRIESWWLNAATLDLMNTKARGGDLRSGISRRSRSFRSVPGYTGRSRSLRSLRSAQDEAVIFEH